MTRDEATAAIAEVWNRVGGDVDQLADAITLSLDNPAIPMLYRVMAMAKVCGTVGEGLAGLAAEDGAESIGLIHRADMLPDIVITLRAAADLFEDANRLRTQ